MEGESIFFILSSKHVKYYFIGSVKFEEFVLGSQKTLGEDRSSDIMNLTDEKSNKTNK